jgi:hypothetical protein
MTFPVADWRSAGRGCPSHYVFDHLQRVSRAAIIEKRLGEVLAWIKQQQDKQPHHRGDLVGPRRSNQKAGLMKDRVDSLAQSTKSRARGARLGRRRCDSDVAHRRPRLPQKLPSDILTLQSKGHLNLVATYIEKISGRTREDSASQSAAVRAYRPRLNRAETGW